MSKIASSAKFQELLKKFSAPTTSKDQREQRKQAEEGKDDAPPSVRKSARDIKQPRRFESPISRPKPKLARGTPAVRPGYRAKENVTPPPRSRPKVTRPEPNPSMSRPRKNEAKKLEETARSKGDRGKPADHPKLGVRARREEPQELSDESDEEFLDSASAVRSPPRGSAFSRVTSHKGDQGSTGKHWNDSHQFLQPQPLASRDPRQRNANRNHTSTWQQLPRNDFESARGDPHPMFGQPETSTRHPMQSRDATMRQPMHSRDPPMRQPMQTRESTLRQPSQSRDVSTRHIFMERDASYIRQPFVRLTDVTRTRDFIQRWDNEFLRPQTPPEVQDLVTVEKSKLQEAINKMIDCPHFTALEVIYTINSIQDTLVVKMEKFCRKRERTESLLRNTLSETMQEASRTDRDKVESWLDGVGPGNHNSSRMGGKRLPDQDCRSVPKRRRLDPRHEYSRYNY